MKVFTDTPSMGANLYYPGNWTLRLQHCLQTSLLTEANLRRLFFALITPGNNIGKEKQQQRTIFLVLQSLLSLYTEYPSQSVNPYETVLFPVADVVLLLNPECAGYPN